MMFCLPLPTREPVTGKWRPPDHAVQVEPGDGLRALDEARERRVTAADDHDHSLAGDVDEHGLLVHRAASARWPS